MNEWFNCASIGRRMVLYIIGLGLGDEKDITVRGLEIVKRCKRLFLEFYTSILGIDNAKLSDFYGVHVELADREMVESGAESIFQESIDHDIGLLVVGDPLCATTHTDMILRARAYGAKVEVVHNASVMGAAASCGLQLYKFGFTVSIPFFEKTWRPDSFYGRIVTNMKGGMHTLCLLDIKVKEPDYDTMMTGRLRYLPPRYMTVNQAIAQLLEVEKRRKIDDPEHVPLIDYEHTKAVGMARLGQPTQLIVYGTLNELIRVDFGAPLHSLALVGEALSTISHSQHSSEGCSSSTTAPCGGHHESADGLHPLEMDMLRFYSIENQRDSIRFLSDAAVRNLLKWVEGREDESDEEM